MIGVADDIIDHFFNRQLIDEDFMEELADRVVSPYFEKREEQDIKIRKQLEMYGRFRVHKQLNKLFD